MEANIKKTKPKLQGFLDDISWSNNSVHGWLRKTFHTDTTRPFHFSCRDEWLISNTPPNEIATKVVDVAEKLKSEKCDVTISEIILRTNKPDLNKKGNVVNTHLKEMCKPSQHFKIRSMLYQRYG